MAQTSADDLKTTPLFERHLAASGRMVPFGGYNLPVQYPSGIMAEHKWTREQAGLFDVSHMGPCYLTLTSPSGDDEADHAAVAALLEPLVCGDIAALKPGQIRYTLLLNAQGGVIDDLMVARSPVQPGSLYIVVNAGTKDNDFALIAAAAGDRAQLRRADDGALLALQGPEAVNVMAHIVPGATELGFMQCGVFDWQGEKLVVSRSGYTGEDGFEILASAKAGPLLWDALLGDDRVKPIGLGARDSLRLEAGLPLYGHDIDRTTTPVMAGLTFAIGKRRRSEGGFPGFMRILAEMQNGAPQKRVGIEIDGRQPVREGALILDGEGNEVGRLTSGGFSPSLQRPIAMGYVATHLSEVGTALKLEQRGKLFEARVAAMPFVPHRYHRKGATA